MKWYVKTEQGDVRGPMSEEDAVHERDRLDGALMFNERIFEPQFVTTPEVEGLLNELFHAVASRPILPPLERCVLAPVELLKRTITHLSREKLVTGTIEGGVLSLDEVPAGVTVDIKDYDVSGDEENLEEDAGGSFSPCRWGS